MNSKIELSQYYKTNAEIALLNNIMRYPSLYQNKTQVLNHWFLVIGNGMEWSDGELLHFRGAERGNRLDKECAAMIGLNHGFCSIYPMCEYSRINDLDKANDDYLNLGIDFIDTILSWDVKNYFGACIINGYTKDRSIQICDNLERCKPLLIQIRKNVEHRLPKINTIQASETLESLKRLLS